MNIKLIARYLGITLIFNAVFMFLSMMVSLIYGIDSSFAPLLISGVITLIVGIFPLIFVRQSEITSVSEGFTITIFAWLLSCIFGMMPYIMWGGEFSIANAWFESVSGYTTTGATILNDIEALPPGLVFWRSSTHFIGGIGVVIFMLLVLPSMSTFRLRMSKMEISSLSKSNYQYRTKEIIRVISIVYISITVISTVSLVLAGMPFFDAVNHAFSIVATGGFSTRNESIMFYDSFNVELVVMVCTVIASLHYGLMYNSIISRSPKIFKSPITRFYLTAILVATLVISFDLLSNGGIKSWGEALRLSSFQVITVSATVGFATADTSVWPTCSILILLMLGIQGACSGSTTGGIKVDRVWILLKSAKTQIKKLLHPSAVVPVKVGNNKIDAELTSSVALFVSLFFFIVIASAIILAASGLDLIDSITSSFSLMSNLGPAFGTCGSLENYGHFSSFAKFIFSLQMLLGRLEIYPLITIFFILRRR